MELLLYKPGYSFGVNLPVNIHYDTVEYMQIYTGFLDTETFGIDAFKHKLWHTTILSAKLPNYTYSTPEIRKKFRVSGVIVVMPSTLYFEKLIPYWANFNTYWHNSVSLKSVELDESN